jgi:hypothetical protein
MTEQDMEELQKKLWQKGEAISMWQHFANTGGADKDRMVTVGTWLLGFSGAIAVILTQELGKQEFKNPWTITILAVLGGLVSSLAIAIITLYAGYSNWNWGMADAIAKRYEWYDLYPNESSLFCYYGEKINGKET